MNAPRRRACGLLPLALIVTPFATKAAGSLAPPVVSPAAPISPVLLFDGSPEQGGLLRGRVQSHAGGGDIRVTIDDRPVPVAQDGRFIIGFGRDAPAAARVLATAISGNATGYTLTVRPRAWSIQSLPTLPRGTTPTPEFLARRTPELARIAAARTANAMSEGWRQRFVWPVSGRISGVFGSQRIYAGEPGAFHGGVDVARPAGTPIVAPADGVVVLAAEAPFTLEGNLLMIDHGMGLVSAFLHLSRIDVRAGDRVRQGQPIGAIGATGRATGPHLHWGVTWQDVRIDPVPLTGPMPPA